MENLKIILERIDAVPSKLKRRGTLAFYKHTVMMVHTNAHGIDSTSAKGSFKMDDTYIFCSNTLCHPDVSFFSSIDGIAYFSKNCSGRGSVLTEPLPERTAGFQKYRNLTADCYKKRLGGGRKCFLQLKRKM